MVPRVSESPEALLRCGVDVSRYVTANRAAPKQWYPSPEISRPLAWSGFASATSSNWGRAFKFQNWPGAAPGFRWVIDGPIWKLERPTPDLAARQFGGAYHLGIFSGVLGSLRFVGRQAAGVGFKLPVLLWFAISRVPLRGGRTEAAAGDFCGMFAGCCWWLFRNGVQHVASDGEYG